MDSLCGYYCKLSQRTGNRLVTPYVQVHNVEYMVHNIFCPKQVGLKTNNEGHRSKPIFRITEMPLNTATA